MNNEFLAIFGEVTPVSAGGYLKKEAVCPPDGDTTPPYTRDPRPDLREDSRDWQLVLANAEALSADLYGRLHFLRCGGARLDRQPKGYRLQPGREDWFVPKVWAGQKQKVLDPVRQQVVWLLRNSCLGQVVQIAEDENPFLHEERQVEFGWQQPKIAMHPR